MKNKQIQTKFFEALISFNSLIFFDLTFKNHSQNMKYAEVKKDIPFTKEYDYFFFCCRPDSQSDSYVEQNQIG